jgi:hypothetical protein
MNDETHAAIVRARDALMQLAYGTAAGADQTKLDAVALEALTGVNEVDELLPYVDADSPSDVFRLRWEFLDRLLKAGDEPPDGDHVRRGRPGKATKAADHLREAASLLSELDNDPLATALIELAGRVQARAATSEITAVMKTEGIAPGTQVLTRYRMRHGSTAHTGTGGRSVQKTEMVRFITRPLNGSAPAEAIATLLSDVLGIACSRRDVEQARQQMKPKSADHEQSPEAALQAAMGFGRLPDNLSQK